MAAAARKAGGEWREALARLSELEAAGVRADLHALRTVYQIVRAATDGARASSTTDSVEAAAAADRLLKRLVGEGAAVDDTDKREAETDDDSE